MSERAQSDSVLAMYGILSGAARLGLPPMVDLPVVRTLRTAMIDRMARSYGVVLTAGARRILVDIEESATIRGNVTQGLRWMIERLVPGGRAVDAVGNVYRTYGAGLLLRRYFESHRVAKDPVFSEIEAERVRAALRNALALLETDRAQALVDSAALPIRRVNEQTGVTLLERWGEAVAATVAEVPAAWLDVAESRFVETLERYR